MTWLTFERCISWWNDMCYLLICVLKRDFLTVSPFYWSFWILVYDFTFLFWAAIFWQGLIYLLYQRKGQNKKFMSSTWQTWKTSLSFKYCKKLSYMLHKWQENGALNLCERKLDSSCFISCRCSTLFLSASS